MGRPRVFDSRVMIVMRIEKVLLAAIEKIWLDNKKSGIKGSRNDLIIRLVERGLDHERH